ncbi:MAG: nickel-dependent hydrogenase large subunit [Candidatus Bipolaricaulaceae bacterium]
MDAQRITTRICGVCPLAHSTASSFCLDVALGISEKIPENGRLLRNLIFGANFLHNHILHFYHLSLPDYLDPRGSPLEGLLLPDGALADRRFSAEENKILLCHYVEALEMRRRAQELVALFGGKMPHDMSIVPGGVTYRPTPGDVAAFRFRLQELKSFIADVYVPDVLLLAERYHDYFEVGKVGKLLSFGGFPEESGGLEKRLFPPGVYRHGEAEPLDSGAIREAVARSWYEGSEAHPLEEKTKPSPEKEEAYSWIKAPRYRGEAFEVGPAARTVLLLGRGGFP